MSMNEKSEHHVSFPSTRWTHVRQAATPAGETGFAALDILLNRYRPALRTHLILVKRMKPERADDVLQGFISDKILAGDLISHANHRRGKFRTFLLTSLDRYRIGVIRKEKAQKRSPGEGCLEDIDELQEHVAAPSSASSQYDVTWAREVIAEALRRVEAECAAKGRSELWGVFHIRVVGPILEGSEAVSYDQLVNRLGFRSPTEASNALVTAKRMFQRNLRDVIGEYVADESEVDEEIAELQAILGGITPR